MTLSKGRELFDFLERRLVRTPLIKYFWLCTEYRQLDPGEFPPRLVLRQTKESLPCTIYKTTSIAVLAPAGFHRTYKQNNLMQG